MAELIFRGDSGVASATGGKTVVVETTGGGQVHIYAHEGKILVSETAPPADPPKEAAPKPKAKAKPAPEPQENLEGEDAE